MIKVTLKKFILAQILILSFTTIAEEIEPILPPILDYIPNCSYQVLKHVSAARNTVNPKYVNPKYKQAVKKLLTKLQYMAKINGADALILTDMKVEKSDRLSLNDKYLISYSADLIKQCDETDLSEKKFAKYNHKGNRTLSTTNSILKVEQKFTFFVNSTTSRPALTNDEISLKNGVYGIKLGEEYHKVIETFGSPSVQLTLLEDELIIGYGRSHWFYFQANKLMKIQSANEFLSQSIINQIPSLEFFDDNKWNINNKVPTKTSLVDAKLLLDTDATLNNKNQMIYKADGATMALDFFYSKNHHSKVESYTLNAFTLQSNDYKPSQIRPFNRHSAQSEAVSQAYKELTSQATIDLHKLEKRLGDPVGKLNINKDTTLNIYNPNLLVTFNNNELSAIHLSDEIFATKLNNVLAIKGWSLGNFNSGAALKDLRVFFPDDVFEIQNKVELQSNNYTLSLLFDENSKLNPLYEAELKLWF